MWAAVREMQCSSSGLLPVGGEVYTDFYLNIFHLNQGLFLMKEYALIVWRVCVLV